MASKLLKELSFAKHRKLYTALGVIVGLFVLLNYVLLPWYVNHGGTLYVPRVIGLPVQAAIAVLDSAGLQPIESDTRPDPQIPPGSVANQNPLPQSIVKPGRRVYLTISGGETQVIVPLLRGRSLRDAKFALERNGLRLGQLSYASSDVFPENTIIDQSISADNKIPRGSAVAITVSRGKVLQESTVPFLVGKTITEAEKLLAESKLRVGNITYQLSFELLPNTVVEQIPRAGEPAQEGQSVDLFVVKAGRPSEEIQAPKK